MTVNGTYKIQLEHIEFDDEGLTDDALLSCFEINKDGSVLNTNKFRINIDLEECEIKALQTEDEYQSTLELNNLLIKIYS